MRIIIASLHFSPGHISHLIAYYKMCNELGYDVYLLVTEKYLPFIQQYSVRTLTSIEQAIEFSPSVIVVYNVAMENLTLEKSFRNSKCKLIYVLHEPFPGFRDLLKEKKYIIRAVGRTLLDSMICSKFDRVLLPSNTAVRNYERYERIFNKHYDIFPLIYPDMYGFVVNNGKPERKYFSFIGGFSSTHGGENFINFIRYAYDNKLDIYFKLATRDDIGNLGADRKIIDMQKEGKLVICAGQPMTVDEINHHYLESICVWNVYNRSTQSGVLGNAFMMGAPVIASKVGEFSNYVNNGCNGFLVDKGVDFSILKRYYDEINENICSFEFGSRETFKRYFSYEVQKNRFIELIEK